MTMRFLRRGEYDLINISLIGFDPVSGKSFDRCMDEWDEQMKSVAADVESLRWWQLGKRIRIAWKLAVLQNRHGPNP